MAKGGIGAVLGVVLVVALASAAFAATTHDEYVSQVNSICKGAAPALKRIPKKIKKTGNPVIDRLQESVLFGKLLTKALNKIEAVPPAPGDEAAVATWIAEGRHEAHLIKNLLNAFIHGKAKRYKVLTKRILISQHRSSLEAAALGLTACSRARNQGVS
jgi:hypothetical protein